MSAVPHNYLDQERGDRANPGFLHPRRQPLRLLFQRLEEIAASEWTVPGLRLLDYGCAAKPYESLFKSKFKEYIGADLPGNKHAQVTIGPGGELPLASESVDCVLSTQVLEHVENPQFYLKEACRVLKPGGTLIISTHGIWRYHPDPVDYWRWTIEGLRLEITRAGFDVWRTQSILRIVSCAMLMCQDATLARMPSFCHPLVIYAAQTLIGWFERKRTEIPSNDASLFLVTASKSPAQSSSSDAEARRLSLAVTELHDLLPIDAAVIIVNEDRWDRNLIKRAVVFPFIERDGQYWGSPANDRVALSELNRLRRLGAQYIVFSSEAFWWLEHYSRLRRFLRSQCRCLLQNDRLLVFDLRSPA